MKALVLIKNGIIELRNTIIEDNKDWALVRIHASGVCGSDIQRAFENGAYHTPLIMGHEFSGIIEKMPDRKSSETSKLNEGDRVVVFPLLPCKKCEPCSSGDYAQCTNYDYFGSRRDGGFAEYVYVPLENLIPIPEHVDITHAAMTEPCAVALHGVRKMRIIPGSTGAVFGAGPIGLMVAQWMSILGCSRIIISDIDDRKLALAQQLGFIPVNPKTENPVHAIQRQCNGGAQHVVEACGLPLTFLQAIQSAGRGGQVVFMGNIKGHFEMGQADFSNLLRKELTIHGTWNSKITPTGLNDWTTSLEMMDKRMRVKELISHVAPLEEGPDLLRKMHARDGFFNKVIFKTV